MIFLRHVIISAENKIQSIVEGAFDGLRNLRHVDLRSNECINEKFKVKKEMSSLRNAIRNYCAASILLTTEASTICSTSATINTDEQQRIINQLEQKIAKLEAELKEKNREIQFMKDTSSRGRD